MSELLLHLATREDWAAAQSDGIYRCPSLDAVGFIHLCHARQLRGVLGRFFKAGDELVLLALDPAAFGAPLKEEPVHGDHFPHLFGALELAAVRTSAEWQLCEGPETSLPECFHSLWPAV